MLVRPLEGYRLWARTYDDAPNPILALEQRVLPHLLGSLRGVRVIDVACGAGRWMELARSQGASVTGVDLCPEMLTAASVKAGLSGRLAVADAGLLPVGNKSADLVLCCFALSYFPSPAAAVVELARITRPGGRVAVTDLHSDALRAGWTRSFRDGSNVYEIHHANIPDSLIGMAAAQNGLYVLSDMDAHFAEPEREIFRQAGKESAFAQAARIPAIRIRIWIKS